MSTDDLLIERLLRVIDEGKRTATYKLALLAGIIDTVAMSPGEYELPTRSIAERVVEIYYPQTRTYTDQSGAAHRPRQISMKSSPVIASVEHMRVEAEAAGLRTVDSVRNRMPDIYAATVEAVETTFVRYPIPLMQVIGTVAVPFLYSVDWPEGTSLRSLRRTGGDRIRLLPNVADRLVVLGPMLRPLIEMHWVRDVARWSGLSLEDEALRAHMFGTERVAFPSSVVGALRELQANECFYCGDPLANRAQVDHFLAWSRWPNDSIENLVLADRCNSLKSDHLAAIAHLTHWRLRNDSHRDVLARAAAAATWPSNPDRTWALARNTYGHLAPGTPLWLREREFELLDDPLDRLISLGQ